MIGKTIMTVAAVALVCAPVESAIGSEAPAAGSGDSTWDASAGGPLIKQAIADAERYIVRIETVGGAQPLSRLPGVRLQGEDESEESPAPNPNQFRDDPGSAFLLADGPTTGIVYSTDGYILTSSFNFVREPARRDGDAGRRQAVGRAHRRP
jgi:hypothetical protein